MIMTLVVTVELVVMRMRARTNIVAVMNKDDFLIYLKASFLPCMVAASMVLHQFAWGISFWSLSQQTNTVPDDDLKLSALSLLVPCADNSPAQ
jgi:hypothetical protein